MTTLKLIILHVLQVFIIALFCVGYFPRKPILNDIASFSTDEMAKINNPVFDKLIVVMIDALRSDFLYDENSKFKNLHEIYNQGHAMGFTAYANPPTVTLPRLKGIMVMTLGSNSLEQTCSMSTKAQHRSLLKIIQKLITTSQDTLSQILKTTTGMFLFYII